MNTCPERLQAMEPADSGNQEHVAAQHSLPVRACPHNQEGLQRIPPIPPPLACTREHIGVHRGHDEVGSFSEDATP